MFRKLTAGIGGVALLLAVGCSEPDGVHEGSASGIPDAPGDGRQGDSTGIDSATRDLADAAAVDAGPPVRFPCSSDPDCGPRGWCHEGGCELRWAIDIEASRHFTCARLGLGGYSCWGSNKYGQLGDGGDKDRAAPADPELGPRILSDLATGSYHACAVAEGLGVQCWGRDSSGQVTGVPGKQVPYPAEVAGRPPVFPVEVAAGYLHSCARGLQGEVACWGSRGYAQTGGHGLPVSAHLVAGVRRTRGLAAANVFGCALRQDGRVLCWGANGDGQLGRGTTNRYDDPGFVKGVHDAVALSTGGRHACVIRGGQSRLWCWGSNRHGQLGTGDHQSASLPVPVTAIAGVEQVEASMGHTCARTEGGVCCWGRNRYGQLGTGDTQPRLLPTRVSGLEGLLEGPPTDIAAGRWHTCALDRRGRVFCWGRNDKGELGIGQASDHPVMKPTEVALPEGAQSCETDADCGSAGWGCDRLACDGGRGVCAVGISGASHCADGYHCGVSGVCEQGECVASGGCEDGNACTVGRCAGGGICVQEATAELCDDGDKCTPSDWCSGGICVTAAWDCDDGNPCTADACWSATGGCTTSLVNQGASCDDGDICTGDGTCSKGSCVGASPVVCPPAGKGCLGPVHCSALEGGCVSLGPACKGGNKAVAPAYTVAAGGDTTCIRGYAGRVRCWGRNDHGQVGAGKVGGIYATPRDVFGAGRGHELAVGEAFACLQEDSARGIRCWGRGDHGALGAGRSEPDRPGAQRLAGLDRMHELAAGRHHVCAIRKGRLICWGDGGSGQLGPGVGGISGPTGVAGIPEVWRVATGGDTTCVITRAGRRVMCWGACEQGQCGVGATLGKAPPAFVGGDLAGRSVRSIAVGEDFACAIASEGSQRHAYCWGRGDFGQLANVDRGSTTLPRRVAAGSRLEGVVAGAHHACAVGPVTGFGGCWGANLRGQLGVGDLMWRAWPSRRADWWAAHGPGRVVALGARHTCALDGHRPYKLWCTGYNAGGRLGVGSTAAQLTGFTEVIALTPELPITCTATADCAGSWGCRGPLACIDGTCVPTGKGADTACDDGDPCTEDLCRDGACDHREAECPDSGPCLSTACGGGKCVLSLPLAATGGVAVACFDDQPCTLEERCAQGSCKAAKKKCPPAPDVSGRVRYRWIPARSAAEGGPGLDYGHGELRPARRILVQALALPPSSTVLDRGTTDDQGRFTLAVPAGTPFRIRALARLRMQDEPMMGVDASGQPTPTCDPGSIDVRVVDNTAGKAQWAIESPSLQATATGLELVAETHWDAQTLAYTERAGAPFAIADSAYEVMRLVCVAGARWPPLQINWSPGNVPEKGYKSKGQIGPSSHFTREYDLDVIYLKGAINWNADEYDDHVVAHEVAHYVEQAAFVSDSIGGPHSVGQALDPRLAFGEGYANAVAAMALRDPVYVNTTGIAQAGGFEVDVGALPPGSERGPHSEISVAWLLFQLWEARDPKPLSGDFHHLAEALQRPVNYDGRPFRTLASFGYHYLHAGFEPGGGDHDGLHALFEKGLDTPVPTDPWDTTNRLGVWYAARRSFPPGTGKKMGAEFWRAYRRLHTGFNPPTGHDRIVLAGYTSPQNKLGASRWYRLRGTGARASIVVGQLQGATCTEDVLDLRVYDARRVIAWNTARKGVQAGCPKVDFPSVAGQWYLLDLRSAPKNGHNVDGWTVSVSWE